MWQWGPDALIGAHRELARTLEQTLLDEHLAIVGVRCDQPGVTVELDGKLLVHGPGAGKRVVLPGDHVISARKPGHFAVVQQVAPAAGKHSRVTVQLSPDRIVGVRRWTAWKPWAVIGAGAALAAVGGGLRFDANRRILGARRAFLAQCDGETLCDPLVERESQGPATVERDVGLGAVIAGSAVVAAGLTLVLLNRPRPVRSEDRSRAPAETTPILGPGVSPGLLPGGAGLSLRWKF